MSSPFTEKSTGFTFGASPSTKPEEKKATGFGFTTNNSMSNTGNASNSSFSANSTGNTGGGAVSFGNVSQPGGSSGSGSGFGSFGSAPPAGAGLLGASQGGSGAPAPSGSGGFTFQSVSTPPSNFFGKASNVGNIFGGNGGSSQPTFGQSTALGGGAPQGVGGLSGGGTLFGHGGAQTTSFGGASMGFLNFRPAADDPFASSGTGKSLF